MTWSRQPWFVGAWRRRSIVVPGGQPTEPCEAWWIQAADAFVDVRVAVRGMEHNGLPYSSTRAFAGRFEIAEGEVRWHVELDSDGPVPRTDRAAAMLSGRLRITRRAGTARSGERVSQKEM